jgi:hypothetical protein
MYFTYKTKYIQVIIIIIIIHSTPVVLSYYRTYILIFNALVFKIFTNFPGNKLEY